MPELEFMAVEEVLVMRAEDLGALADLVEGAAEPGAALAADVAEALAAAFPAAAPTAGQEVSLLVSTEAALRVVDGAVPAWEIALKGIALEPSGHWHCTLRETSITDDDAVTGLGEAPSLPRTLIAALLRIAAANDRT